MNLKKLSALIFLVTVFITSSSANKIFVSPAGNDSNSGTKKNPLKTLSQAKIKAYQLLKQRENEAVTIWLADGIYLLTEPLKIEADILSSENGSICFRAVKGAKPVVSGGTRVTGWTKNNNGLWIARLPENTGKRVQPRELFIDGKRAVRARHPNSGYLRIKEAGADNRTNFYFTKGDFPVVKSTANMELILLHDWSISRIAIKSVDTVENKLTAVDSIGARNPEFFDISYWEPNPRYFLENAPEFLDKDFEWAYQKENRQLLLQLPENVNPDELQIVIPVAESLFLFEGKENNPLKNISFKGITFQYCNWQIPDKGYCGIQACHFDPRPLNEGWAVVPAAIQAVWAENVRFENCIFKNLGGSGLWFSTGCKSCCVESSVFTDISGNGVMVGEGQDRLVNGKPWWESAPEQVALGNKIENCRVTECGSQFFGAVGIWCGLTAETSIIGNEVFNLPYSGISVGWMWSPVATPCRDNIIEGNHIHHIMNILSDGGGIYMLGLQPGSAIRNNHIHDVQINAGRAESNGMFLDEGITDVIVENNLIYNIAKSPLRFHKATKNLVKGNYLFCSDGNPPVRYNSTKEEDIEMVNNEVFNDDETGYKTKLNMAVENWNRFNKRK